jgi:hypothetical protein
MRQGKPVIRAAEIDTAKLAQIWPPSITCRGIVLNKGFCDCLTRASTVRHGSADGHGC